MWDMDALMLPNVRWNTVAKRVCVGFSLENLSINQLITSGWIDYGVRSSSHQPYHHYSAATLHKTLQQRQRQFNQRWRRHRQRIQSAVVVVVVGNAIFS